MSNVKETSHVNDVLAAFLKEDHRLVADNLFAQIALLRGKPHKHHDDRSDSMSLVQMQTLEATAEKMVAANKTDIDKLSDQLVNFSEQWSSTNNGLRLPVVDAIRDSDCRAALATALVLLEKSHDTNKSLRVTNTYCNMRQDRAQDAMKEMMRASADVVARGTFERVKNEADELTQRVRSCTEKLQAKKNANPTVELERSIETVLTQSAEMQKNFDAMTQELKAAKNDLANAQEQQDEVAVLKAQLNEMSEKCNENEEKADALAERICCSICEDHEKIVSFACGHMCCSECASKWGKCPMRCASERTGKPVKFFFPLFL